MPYDSLEKTHERLLAIIEAILAQDQETTGPFVTILTPAGKGAIGVVRVWGRGGVNLADASFRPARGVGLRQTPNGRLRLGRIGRGLGDEAVAVVLDREPDVLEIQCHGGSAAIAMVVDALKEGGATWVDTEDWAEEQAGSPLRAAAMRGLARASTLRTAEILLEQAEGALDRELSGLIAAIRDHHPEARGRLDRLIARGGVGTRLVTGWRISIAGRPNVGKSRLLNALAGYQRAIVDPTPGTTRDVVTAATAIGGWPVQFADTAGLRETADPIEMSGIERAVQEVSRADLVLKVIDSSSPIGDEDVALLRRDLPSLIVASKMDLEPRWGPSIPGFADRPVHWVSAETGEGLDALIAAIGAAIVPEPPEPDAGVPLMAGQLSRLEQAREALGQGDRERAVEELMGLLGRGALERRYDSARGEGS